MMGTVIVFPLIVRGGKGLREIIRLLFCYSFGIRIRERHSAGTCFSKLSAGNGGGCEHACQFTTLHGILQKGVAVPGDLTGPATALSKPGEAALPGQRRILNILTAEVFVRQTVMRWPLAVVPADCHNNAVPEPCGFGPYRNTCQAWKNNPTFFRTAVEGRI
jgi:hypothetical protein